MSTTPQELARDPRGASAAAPVALLLAVLLVVAGAALVRDALVLAGLLDGTAWTTSVLTALDGARPRGWMLPAGLVVALEGLWWVVAALFPRQRTELAVGESGTTWTRPADLARLVRAHAQQVDGVTGARAGARRRSVRVDVTTTAAVPADTVAPIERTLTSAIAAVRPAPRVRVRARAAKVSS